MSLNNSDSKLQTKEKHCQLADNEPIGSYRELFSARTEIEGQDGGVVSSLIIKGLKEKLFDSAIVVRRSAGYTGEAIIAQETKDVLDAKGTIYLRIDVIKRIQELVGQNRKKVVVVCTPCQAATVRKLIQKFASNIDITILGLFCFESFNYCKLKEETKNLLGIELDKVTKIQIRHGKFIAKFQGEDFTIQAKDLHQASEVSCNFCEDFTSKLADISIGSVGSKLGYSTVIVRSKVGEELVKGFEAKKETVNKEEINKISQLKINRAKHNLSNQRT